MSATLGDRLDSWLGRVLRASRKGSIHRFYLRRAGDEGRWGLFIHRIMQDDDKEVFHNHPWDGIALVFGSYFEETPTTPLKSVRFFNRVRHRGSHRVGFASKILCTFASQVTPESSKHF